MSQNNLATKKDLKRVNAGLKTDINAVKSDLKEVETRLGNSIDRLDGQLQDSVFTLMKHIKSEGQKTRQHFDTVVEQIESESAGANADQFSLQDDKLASHNKRIGRIESAIGLG